MRMEYSIKTKYGEIIHDPLFRNWEFMLDYQRSGTSSELDDLTLQELGERMGWDAAIMAEGASYLYDRQRQANAFFRIWDDCSPETGKEMTGLAAFTCEEQRPFVLICPGGGYSAVCCMLEGYPLAKKLNELGYAAFVLSYRVEKNCLQPNPQEDVAQAAAYILSHHAEFNVDKEHYAVVGFSAGAHAAGCFGTEELGYMKYALPKPDMMVLGYPVITMGGDTHLESRENLFGKEHTTDSNLIEKYSIERHVTQTYPRTFLWQCKEDPMVPCRNSELMQEALARADVPYSYEVYPYASHGLPVNAGIYERDWLNRAISFWKGKH